MLAANVKLQTVWSKETNCAFRTDKYKKRDTRIEYVFRAERSWVVVDEEKHKCKCKEGMKEGEEKSKLPKDKKIE